MICPICGSKNIVKHHDALPRWSRKKTRDGGIVKECMQCSWYVCKDCGQKFFVDRKVPERKCPQKRR